MTSLIDPDESRTRPTAAEYYVRRYQLVLTQPSRMQLLRQAGRRTLAPGGGHDRTPAAYLDRGSCQRIHVVRADSARTGSAAWRRAGRGPDEPNRGRQI